MEMDWKCGDRRCGAALTQIAENREITGGTQAHSAQPVIARRRRPPGAKIREIPNHLHLIVLPALSVAHYL
jgi:hypothetical protein